MTDMEKVREALEAAAAALKPFADAFKDLDPDQFYRGEADIWEHPVAMAITFDHLRRAGAASEVLSGLASLPAEEVEPGSPHSTHLLKLHCTNEWLREKIESDPDLETEAGAPPPSVAEAGDAGVEAVAIKPLVCGAATFEEIRERCAAVAEGNAAMYDGSAIGRVAGAACRSVTDAIRALSPSAAPKASPRHTTNPVSMPHKPSK